MLRSCKASCWVLSKVTLKMCIGGGKVRQIRPADESFKRLSYEERNLTKL